MNLKARVTFITILLVILQVWGGGAAHGEQMPEPTYDNSVIFSITHDFMGATNSENQYIFDRFGGGIYAPLYFSSFVRVPMSWNLDISNVGNGIKGFMDRLDQMLIFARDNGVGLHLTLNYGMSRALDYYAPAKEEDIRNCQWYNDNNISSQTQMRGMADPAHSGLPGGIDLNFVDLPAPGLQQPDYVSASPTAINDYVFTTFSRYARKLRAHLEAKVEATFAHLKRRQNDFPTVRIVVSAPGESELNYHRLNDSPPLQNYFCDYSPFAILEFRDWVRHTGMYAAGGKYSGQGYSGGGSRYGGSSGLSNFNADFGTSFSSWDLKYYNWSLSDPVDSDYTDGSNPDPGIIPVSQYSYNGMKPSSGSHYIAGGFDAPRTMSTPGTNGFYDLWHTFRETLVYHYVRDMAVIARAGAFPKNQYFTHQIPADYLFGSRPNDPSITTLNPRYYASASPLWTADVFSDMGVGVTVYDINFGSHYARTSKYLIGAASAFSNWAALEYNPEVLSKSASSVGAVSVMYEQMLRLYGGNPHIISFFKWLDSTPGTSVYRFKGTNRETAARNFFNAIRDIARKPIGTVFTPKKVEDCKFVDAPSSGTTKLDWTSKIWPHLSYRWTDWQHFQSYVVYRGTTANFTANAASEIGRTTNSGFLDTNPPSSSSVYYKVAAVNTSGQVGPTVTVGQGGGGGTDPNPSAKLSVSRNRLNFGYVSGKAAPPVQTFRISNTGSGGMNWTATDSAGWLSCGPASGSNGALVTVSVNASGLAAGSYSTTITVAAPGASGSPKTIPVSLTVKNTYQDQPPFGGFATPTDGATVRGSVAVTGWVMDDVGVDNVKIYRNPVSGEGSGWIYIGDAVFVEGARPDLESAYPDYPGNYKAGWGYMALTNFLPNNGNGTFTLHARATDAYGKQTILGSKTIVCDNANAVKPFGAIDTPKQGGNAAGSNFINWGWVLTPMPNMIPTDGSTIDVYVDGVKVGNVKYNIQRQDLAGFFPGYANSSNAAGYFIMDTNSYADGVHTIAWNVRDSGGNTAGIGSRYFTIDNSGSYRDSESGTASRGNVIPFDLSGPGLSRLPRQTMKAVTVFTGFAGGAPGRTVYPDAHGDINLSSSRLQRLVIPLGARYGYQVVGDQRRSLPVGSTLGADGVFFWQPGPAFAGEFVLEFLVPGEPGRDVDNALNDTFGDADEGLRRQRVRITIL